MIILTRLGGREMAVNPDLIERAEATPDTVITMIDGHKLVVCEPIDELIELVSRWRAGVAARAYTLSGVVDAPDAVRIRRVADHEDAVATHAAMDTAVATVLRLPQRKD